MLIHVLRAQMGNGVMACCCKVHCNMLHSAFDSTVVAKIGVLLKQIFSNSKCDYGLLLALIGSASNRGHVEY